MNARTLLRFILIGISVFLLLVAVWSGLQVYRLSGQRAEIKKDYSALNNITSGLLSVNAWRDHLVRVVTNRIDDFEFTAGQQDTLEYEVAQVLHAMINRADSLMDRKQRTLGGKIKKLAVKAIVKEDKLHKQVPVFARTIVDEIKKPKNRAKLKALAVSKLQEFGSITYDSTNDVKRYDDILEKYGAADLQDFNRVSAVMLNGLQSKAYFFTFVVLGIMVVFLITWWLLRHQAFLHTPFFVMSVLLALVVLIVGLTSPMIEIDARIKEMSFLLIGERITFNDQVIFFQSKSIVDVVRILIETGKYDSAIVGILILMFSIIFPIGKLLSTKVYLLGNERWRNNAVVRYFAFKSGKWSMADVNVVAIFMAYIGFKGILDSQMQHLNLKTDSLASISTNETSLQPGFILFVGFVLFGLVLSVILNKITTHAVVPHSPGTHNAPGEQQPALANS